MIYDLEEIGIIEKINKNIIAKEKNQTIASQAYDILRLIEDWKELYFENDGLRNELLEKDDN